MTVNYYNHKRTELQNFHTYPSRNMYGLFDGKLDSCNTRTMLREFDAMLVKYVGIYL